MYEEKTSKNRIKNYSLDAMWIRFEYFALTNQKFLVGDEQKPESTYRPTNNLHFAYFLPTVYTSIQVYYQSFHGYRDM